MIMVSGAAEAFLATQTPVALMPKDEAERMLSLQVGVLPSWLYQGPGCHECLGLEIGCLLSARRDQIAC